MHNNAVLMSEKCRKQSQVLRHQLVAGAEIKATILRPKRGLYP
jgi:acid stress-induced BolA-like protein IbaG/YrbA